jgi:hypothetical protein
MIKWRRLRWVEKIARMDDIKNEYKSMGRHGGVVVSVLATGPKGCGFKTQPSRWIFKSDKNPQHNFLSDGK